MHACAQAIGWLIVWRRRRCVRVAAIVIDQEGCEGSVGLLAVCVLRVGKTEWGSKVDRRAGQEHHVGDGDDSRRLSAYWRFRRAGWCTGNKLDQLTGLAGD